MNEGQSLYAAETLMKLVPQWYYDANFGPNQKAIEVNGFAKIFFSHAGLTPDLDWLFARINGTVNNLVATAPATTPLVFDLLQEHYALEWLGKLLPSVNWKRVIYYLSKVSRRTSENSQVSLNLVFADAVGTDRIDLDWYQRIVDQAATSPFTYVRVDGEIRFLEYGEIPWSAITDSTSYNLHPGFLHPIHCILGDGECSAHVTSRGDIVVMNKRGLVASRRKGSWKLYDVRTLKNSIVGCMNNNYNVGCNLFEILFDLSFRRHGALLVFDPNHVVISHIVNKEANLATGGSGQSLFAPSIQNLAFGVELGSLKARRQIAEMASVDGAVIFDRDSILAVAAVIESHPAVGGTFGARTTAAKSAFQMGGFPAKVSSDGEVTFYFKSEDEAGNVSDATMELL